MLIYAGSLIAQGVEPVSACSVALVRPITDDVGYPRCTRRRGEDFFLALKRKAFTAKDARR